MHNTAKVLFVAFALGSPCLFAGPIFVAESTSCGSGSPSGYSGSPQTSGLPVTDGVQGIRLSGMCAAFFPASTENAGYDLLASMSGGSGGPDTFLLDIIHVTWKFTPDSDLFTPIDWLVWVTINDSTQQFGGTGDPGFEVVGEGDISVPRGGFLESWDAGIGLTQPGRIDWDTTLSLSIPGQSLDIGETTAPEPTVTLPIALALGCLAVRRRKRNASSLT